MNKATVRVGLAVILVSAAGGLFAAEDRPKVENLTGKVVHVVDGDTFTLLVEKTRRKIRLAGIDAPEAKQPFGDEARKALSKELFGKTVQVRVLGKGEDGSALGVVRLEDRCINTELVRQGCAWHDVEANKSRTLAKAEKQARADKRGLWAGADPMPPWQWREIEESKQDSGGAKSKAAPAEKKVYWLNTQSNIRHNSRCKYYKKTKEGRMCGPNEGRPCKICGG
jgi:micrococcal nuclease